MKVEFEIPEIPLGYEFVRFGYPQLKEWIWDTEFKEVRQCTEIELKAPEISRIILKKRSGTLRAKLETTTKFSTLYMLDAYFLYKDVLDTLMKHELFDFRPAKKGEKFLDYDGMVHMANFDYKVPTLIL